MVMVVHNHLLEPQPDCGGSNPQYVAPELMLKNDDPFDGYAVDLWACGVMLFVMLLGSDHLFAAPVPDDRKFQEICVRSNLKNHVRDLGSSSKKNAIGVSDAALDLLQRMLRAEPRDRLTLSQVQEHPWLTTTITMDGDDNDDNNDESSNTALSMQWE
jgi:serine/threonine protein kinase